jgi:surface protein
MGRLRDGFAAVAVVAGLGAGALCLPATTALATDSGETQPMYRLYNPNSGEHFYTKNGAERDHLARVGWRSEGTGWTAPTKSDTPVYRLYNANAGDHHYTRSMGERDMLVKAGWSYEGIGWYSSDTGAIPLYRQYNPNAKAGSHNYTASKAENDHLVRLGWRAEGIGWYGVDTSKDPGKTVTAEGQFGEGCTWTLYGDGKLEISPTDGRSGTMEELSERIPSKYLSKIISIVVDKGVKAPADSSFLFVIAYNDTGYVVVPVTSIDVSNLDVSGVRNMTGMFGSCPKVTSIKGLDTWDVSNVTNMFHMFGGCDSLTDLTGVEKWNVSNVTNMGGMFYDCYALRNLSPLAKWNVSRVTDASQMFYGCQSLSDATSLEGWGLPSDADKSYMFDGCAGGIKTPSWYKG